MRHIGLVIFGFIRILTQLTWPLIGEYWYFVGQSMFETYVLLYAMMCVKNHLFVPICYLFNLSLFNLITDLTGFSFGTVYQIIFALLLTFGISIWNYKQS